MAQAGWYPSGDGQERWFDGDNWTNKVRSPSNAPLPPLPENRPPVQRESGATKPTTSPRVDYNPKMDVVGGGVTQPKKGGVWWGCVGCIAIIAIPGIAFGIYSATRDRSGDADELREVQAISACEDQVRAQLKSPSTASFSNMSASGNGSSWDVVGSVDAENSFGAAIRSDFNCDVKFTGGNSVGVIVTGLQ